MEFVRDELAKRTAVLQSWSKEYPVESALKNLKDILASSEKLCKLYATRLSKSPSLDIPDTLAGYGCKLKAAADLYMMLLQNNRQNAGAIIYGAAKDLAGIITKSNDLCELIIRYEKSHPNETSGKPDLKTIDSTQRVIAVADTAKNPAGLNNKDEDDSNADRDHRAAKRKEMLARNSGKPVGPASLDANSGGSTSPSVEVTGKDPVQLEREEMAAKKNTESEGQESIENPRCNDKDYLNSRIEKDARYKYWKDRCNGGSNGACFCAGAVLMGIAIDILSELHCSNFEARIQELKKNADQNRAKALNLGCSCNP